MFFFSRPACPMLAISSISPHPALAILSGAYPIFFARFLRRLRLPMCLTLVFFVNNAPFIRSFSLGCFAILPNRRICIQGGLCLRHPPAVRARLQRRMPFLSLLSFLQYLTKHPLIDFLLLISNFRSSSSPRLFASIITIFSHFNSGGFQTFYQGNRTK